MNGYTLTIAHPVLGELQLDMQAPRASTAIFEGIHHAFKNGPDLDTAALMGPLTITLKVLKADTRFRSGSPTDPAFSLVSDAPSDVEQPTPNKTGRSG